MMCKFMNIKVHCQWGNWNVGDCSKSCGGGTRTRTRTPKVLPEHGGDQCDGPDSIDESCNIQGCQGTKSIRIRLRNYRVLYKIVYLCVV